MKKILALVGVLVTIFAFLFAFDRGVRIAKSVRHNYIDMGR